MATKLGLCEVEAVRFEVSMVWDNRCVYVEDGGGAPMEGEREGKNEID